MGLADGHASPFFVPEAADVVEDVVETEVEDEGVVEAGVDGVLVEGAVEVANVVGVSTLAREVLLLELWVSTAAVATLPTFPSASSTRRFGEGVAD